MGVYGSANVGFILLDGYNILGVITEIVDTVEALLENNHALGDAWFKSYPTGLSKFELSQKGFYDDTANSDVTALVGSMGASRVFCWTPEGNTIEKHFAGFQAPVQGKLTRMPALGGLNKLDVVFGANGKLEVGQILHAHGTETAATGNTQSTPADSANDSRLTSIPITGVTAANPAVVTTGVPHGFTAAQVANIAGCDAAPSINGSQIVTVISTTTFSVPVDTSAGTPGTTGTARALSTVNGGAAYIETESLTLGDRTNFAPLVKHSTDNITYVTIATFTVQTAAPVAERVAVAAGTTIRRYLAMAWSWTGGSTGQSVKFFVGFARA